MNFPDAIRAGFTNYATFTGRASRPEFWWWILFTALVSAALNSFNVATPEGTFLVGSSISGVWSVAALLPTLAVTVRRLRDAGRSWAELFWLLLPIAGLIVLIVHLCDAPRPPVLGTAPHGALADPVI
ncbi:DUF805 domain-containing protein [Herbiconiux ginsengi]|uniref:Uncharacterized membrane protein YhaH, DUF805 family n=1 Tax=Herbiconiux ginsengi TaxID=381665 RepID=A0A1H3SXU4_9MICO|nr:DUF805 domain-containing protein [Herbiconiux ginsengi]SDZ42754.1 Uncharacterized membrane protein YhaH, DUF805 family [Herbiconiux ginsengi]